MPLSFSTLCQQTALTKWWVPNLKRFCSRKLTSTSASQNYIERSLAGPTRWAIPASFWHRETDRGWGQVQNRSSLSRWRSNEENPKIGVYSQKSIKRTGADHRFAKDWYVQPTLTKSLRTSSTTWVMSSSSNYMKSLPKRNARLALNIGQMESCIAYADNAFFTIRKAKIDDEGKVCFVVNTPLHHKEGCISRSTTRKAWETLRSSSGSTVSAKSEKEPVRISSRKISKTRLLSRIANGNWVDGR